MEFGLGKCAALGMKQGERDEFEGIEWQNEEREGLEREGDKIKFDAVRFERRQIVGMREERSR